MTRILERLYICAQELTAFQRRATDLRSETDSLISGSRQAINQSLVMIAATGGDGAGRASTDPLSDEFPAPRSPSEDIDQTTNRG
ncbi:MAG: hypothetical protein ACR652_26835 [Methylocystis sp.]|uniref:hypothetical protein n=1 Tax=Methylocystis sp. TaxID=1911079 RepID=UPI003DA601E8